MAQNLTVWLTIALRLSRQTRPTFIRKSSEFHFHSSHFQFHFPATLFLTCLMSFLRNTLAGRIILVSVISVDLFVSVHFRCPMTRMGVSGWVFLLVPAYLGSPGPTALCVSVCVCVLLFTSTVEPFCGLWFTSCYVCIHTYMHTYKQICRAPKITERIWGTGAGWLDGRSGLEETGF